MSVEDKIISLEKKVGKKEIDSATEFCRQFWIEDESKMGKKKEKKRAKR